MWTRKDTLRRLERERQANRITLRDYWRMAAGLAACAIVWSFLEKLTGG